MTRSTDVLLRRPGSDDIAVRADDLGQILLSALRYATGRRTYITGQTADLIRAYWPALPDKWRELIERDLNYELGLTERLGDQCDHDAWVSLRDWFKQAREQEQVDAV